MACSRQHKAEEGEVLRWGECGHSGLEGDSLLGAGVVCDLLHNLTVAFVSHDLVIPTKL